ncbi:MAG TPA: polyprenyl synthetase family protein, partial [Acidimicrobiales bacterium]|nr:polyprenyl synthetase family protein [Acidimicrobiales bacterium]
AALAAPGRLAAVGGPLSAYGLPLGEAFQLTDDLLGVFGDTALTGKPVGEDLREGKPTLLYALARAAAAGPDLRLLDERFGAPDLDAAEIAALQHVIEASGAREQVAGIVDGLVDEALDAAERLPLDALAVDALVELARFVAGRDH